MKLFAANYNEGALWAYDALETWLAQRDIEMVKIQAQSDEDIIAHAGDAEIFLAYKYRVTGALMAALPTLRLVMSSSSGYDHIDTDAASAQGIVVTSAATHNVEDVAENALALILACARKLSVLDRAVRAGGWRPDVHPVYRLRGKTLGLVGFGRIARALAWRAQGIGLRVIATSRSASEADMQKANVESVSLIDLLAQSDFVSLHLISSAETRHTIKREHLQHMKPGAFLINTSRGDLIDESALIEALDSGWIAGAGLDVLTQEPPPAGHPLIGRDNVFVSGHSAASTVDAAQNWVEEWKSTVTEFLEGYMPPGVVNPRVQPKIPLKDKRA